MAYGMCFTLHPILPFQLIPVSQNGSLPVTIRQQNILTYPTFNIAQCPGLMTRMDTNAGAAVEIWSPLVKQWRQEDVDHSMNIKGQPELHIRFLGVTNCPNHSQLIGEEPVLESTPNKWKFEADNQYESLIVQARQSTASTWLPSPTSSNLSATQPYSRSISISPSPFSSMHSSPNFSSLNLYTASSDGNDLLHWAPLSPSPSLPKPNPPANTHNSLWAAGHVYVPENNGPWPSGMYARDMAWAFTRLQETRGDVETRFRQVFPGASWVKATYYWHKDAFFGSTSTKIEKCRSLPRSAGGLWANWKSTSTGWKKLAAKSKKSSEK